MREDDLNVMQSGWPILVVGAQRSGTTALGRVVASVLGEAGTPFTINGRLPYLLRHWWTAGELAARHGRADDVAHALRRRPPDTPEPERWLARAELALTAAARRVAGAAQPPSTAEEVRRICRDTYGTAAWGDKYNEYLLQLPWLLEVFPQARWIFICRAPGEAVASMLAWRGKPWNPELAEDCGLKWAHWNRLWLDARHHIERSRRVELRYDDVCAGRAAAASDLLGIDLAPTLRRCYARQPGADRGPAVPREAGEIWGELMKITTARA